MSSSDYVRIFDTTLRDGEQSPGATMTSREKLEIARALSRLGVDVIEAGFPAASPDDLAAVRAVAEQVGAEPTEGRSSDQPPIVCGLARAKRSDIETAWEAVKNAARPRIHTFLATSPIHREHKLRMDRQEVLDAVRAMVAFAREKCEDIEFSAEDAARTEPEFLYEVVAAALEAGATTINIPDTVGYATPDEMARLIGGIREHVPGVDRAILSVHCHDDLGMATANTLAAIGAGARQAEVTINGIGERAGNTALEEVVMALATRAPRFGLQTGIDTTRIHRTSRLVSQLTGMVVQPNKAIVGANAFAHEAGIHQDGMLKHGETYEIMRPQMVGVPASRLVLGKHSGRHAFGVRLSELGYGLEGAALDEAFQQFKALADRKKQVTDADLDLARLLPAPPAGRRVHAGGFADLVRDDGHADRHRPADRAGRRHPGGGRPRQRAGRRLLRGHRRHRRHLALPPRVHRQLGDRGHRRARRSERAHRRRAGAGDGQSPARRGARASLSRPRHRYRHPGGQRQGLPERSEPADHHRARAAGGPESELMSTEETKTLFEKVWDAHVVHEEPDCPAILYVDLHLVHEVTSPQAFAGLGERGLTVRRPDRTLATMDHSTPTKPGLAVVDAQAATQLARLAENCAAHGIELHARSSDDNGIVHVIGPELGRTQPGMTIVCGDSHTSTHGAFGALAFGIGTSEVEHVLATQCLLQHRPKTFSVRFDGALQPNVTAKDLDPGVDRRDRRRRRDRARAGVSRRGGRAALDGGPDDPLQHVDRGGRAGRDDRARRDHLRVPRRSPRAARRGGLRATGRWLARAGHRPGRALRP